jgi:hypothetical protein
MTDEAGELDFALLPDELQPLAPLIRRYAVSDDVLRGDRLAEATDEDLRELAAAASPHWDAINAFLDDNLSPPGPRQDVAVALDSFAQAALEAPLELAARSAR